MFGTQFQKLKQFEYLQLFSAYYGRTHLTLIYINKSSHFTDGNQEEKKWFVQMMNIKGLETDTQLHKCLSSILIITSFVSV